MKKRFPRLRWLAEEGRMEFIWDDRQARGAMVGMAELGSVKEEHKKSSSSVFLVFTHMKETKAQSGEFTCLRIHSEYCENKL